MKTLSFKVKTTLNDDGTPNHQYYLNDKEINELGKSNGHCRNLVKINEEAIRVYSSLTTSPPHERNSVSAESSFKLKYPKLDFPEN